MTISDKELDEFISKEVVKDIEQADSIDDKQVEDAIQSMGFLWDVVHKKLTKDGICFVTKNKVDFSGEKLHVLQASNSEAGVVAFVSVSEKGLEILKKQEIKTEE